MASRDRYEVLVLAKSCPSLHTRTALDDATPDHHRMGRARMRYDATRHTRCDSARCPTGASLALLSPLSPLRAPSWAAGRRRIMLRPWCATRRQAGEARRSWGECKWMLWQEGHSYSSRIIIILSYYPLIMAPHTFLECRPRRKTLASRLLGSSVMARS
jgi:hypothetical protein